MSVKTKNDKETKSKEFLCSRFQVKAADAEGDTGFLSGIMSVFSTVDQGDDIVHPGAFTRTIQAKKGVVPFLLDHNPYKPAGYSTRMEEQSKGLYYEAEFRLHDPEVKQRYELAKLSLKLGTSMGNSFGYRAVKWDYEEKEVDGIVRFVRNLREVKLFEGSLVTFPMHEDAGVTDAKAAEYITALALLQKRGYSLNQIQDALSKLEDSKASETRAQEIDPALRHSIDALKSIFNG